MRHNDFTAEFSAVVRLLELRAGEVALDAQCEPDRLLELLHNEVTDNGRMPGRAIGLSFGKDTRAQVEQMIADGDLDRAEVLALHPSDTRPRGEKPGLRAELCHGIVLRHDLGIPDLAPVLREMRRVAKPGARVVARHVDWSVKLPKATEREQEMIDALASPDCKTGPEFFAKFQTALPGQPWRDVRFDVFTLAHRDERNHQKTRYRYDWRRMMREQLLRARVFDNGEVKRLIDRLETTRGAKVIADRYLALGIEP